MDDSRMKNEKGLYDPIKYFNGNQLTFYDLNREPLPVIRKNTNITMRMRELSGPLTCSICMGILRQCHTVMLCLHRFCKDCIITSIRLSKKECPTCRSPVMTRRDLRPDTTMDKLIELIYGDVDKFEQQEEQYIERLNSSFNRQNMTESIERGQQRQETIRKKIERQLKARNQIDLRLNLPIVMKPLPGAPNVRPLEKALIWTSHRATCDQVARYIGSKQAFSHLKLYARREAIVDAASGSRSDASPFKRVPREMAMVTLYQKQWETTPDEPLYLFFAIDEKANNKGRMI